MKSQSQNSSRCHMGIMAVLALTALASLAHGQTLTVLYSFTGGADGRQPVAGLVRDTAGNLYGTTQFGGTFVNGTVFKVSAAGVYQPASVFRECGEYDPDFWAGIYSGEHHCIV